MQSPILLYVREMILAILGISEICISFWIYFAELYRATRNTARYQVCWYTGFWPDTDLGSIICKIPIFEV